MSSFRSFLRSFHISYRKKNHHMVAIVTVCTLATGALVLTGEEQYVGNINITAEAKEKTVIQNTNFMQVSNPMLLQSVKESGATKELKTLNGSTDQATITSTIITEASEGIKQTLIVSQKMFEDHVKSVQKQQQEEKAKQEAEAKKIKVSNEDLETLQRIVEAEAGDQDVEGRMLVANVVLNRVKEKEFPNSISGVVYEHKGRHYQFSPAASGSIHRVKISKTTKKAVERVLNGEDQSKGALYFVQRNIANKHSLSWFDRDLTKLFKHGCHTFYK